MLPPLLLLLLLSISGRALDAATDRQQRACKLSELRCSKSDVCVAQDKFCDGEDDCDDKSDEPAYCTPCNRTLYGDVGRTYELQVRRPREERLPFLCHLNFTAAGQEFGDLVQLTFDTFTVGRFLSFTSDGCPDGHMSISEEDRPPTGGQWCGSAWGYTVYYSETRSINLTLFLSRLSGQGNGYNFDFKLSYKFLRRSEAHLRYGNSSMSTWRGELVNATYCDRVFTRCDRRACRLQSPNYPGVYPRNATCYYRVEQKQAPPGHRALLAVSQRNSHKIHIKDQNNKYDTSQRTLRLWDQCNVVQDYLTVYDGGSNTDRILVRLCGGDAVPDIVSSRDTMLLEFHTSPYDNPFHPVPLSFLPGFELEVQVIFVDERSSASFVLKEKEKCDFYISSYESSSGTLENPKHSLPPNTTCRYHFQAKPNEIVWLAFVKYYAATSEPATSLATATDVTGSECNVKLLIWNGERGGNGGGSNGPQNGLGGAHDSSNSAKENATLLGEFCKDEVPRLCDHSLLRNGSRHTRPCSMSESYVSTGRHLTLEHELRHGSALYPVSFVLRYEFVHEASSCNRVFTAPSNPAQLNEFQSFGSPRSVFFYGRGGAANLSCVYRFEAGPDKRLELSITKAAFGGRNCKSRIDPLVNRWACDRLGSKNSKRESAQGIAELRLSEYPWQGVRLPRDCLCSNVSERLVFASLSSSQLELSFVVTRMNVTQDYLDFFFEGEYRFVSADQPSTSASGSPGSLQSGGSGSAVTTPHACHGSSRSLSDSPRLSRLQERRLRGTSGEISLRSPPLQPISTVTGSPTRNAANPEAASRRESSDHLTNINAGVATIDESLGPDGSGSAAEVTRCVNEPWLIEPEDSRLHFLYLKTPGFRLERHNVRDCPTRNRIVVYPAANPSDRVVVCPAENNASISNAHLNLHQQHQSNGQGHQQQQQQHQQPVVDLISGGWNSNTTAMPADSQHSRSFVVEFLQHQPGYYVVTWMAISKRLLSAPGDNFFGNALQPAGAPCPYRCPELDACISSVLWCDGVRHCPSGFDEREENCSYRLGVTLLYVAVGAGALGIFLILLLATGCLKYCLYRRRRLQRRQLQKKLPPQASSASEKQQHSSSKKKVQVLSANHLGSPVSRGNNGTLQDTSTTTAQPRYANATFARIGRYDSLNRHQHLHSTLRRQQQQQQQQQLQQKLPPAPPQAQFRPDDEEDDFAEKYTNDSIC